MNKTTLRLTLSIIIFGFLVSFGCTQVDVEKEHEQITSLLDEFLTNVGDPEMHDRLWAEDLVYTGSAGIRHGKETIMNSMQEADTTASDVTSPSYSFEDLDIKVFGTTAAVTFQLVAETPSNSGVETMNYLNSGFFEKRNGMWKAVVWQATKMAESSGN